MNIIERGRAFLQSLQELAGRSAWDWKRCPQCGNTLTIKNGSYTRHPWFLGRRETVRVQRHLCHQCVRTYSEHSALLVRGSWYAREVHRAAVDHWQHLGTSLRRTAEVLRSWMGRQERWRLWRPLDAEPPERCYLAASTVHRWLGGAGKSAQASVDGQLAGIGQAQELGTDGLWAKLKGKAPRVVLLVVDSISGLIYPPVVAKGEESAGPWQRLFERAKRAGLDLAALRGVTSDGAQGLRAYLRCGLAWVQHQRCVWHLWRNLGGELSRAASKAAEGLLEEAAEQARKQVRGELTALIHQIMDAGSYEQAEAALATLLGHPLGATIGKLLNEQLDRVLVHLLDYCSALGAGGAGLGHLPQLRARAMEVRAQTPLSVSRPKCPPSGRRTTRTSKLPGRFGRVNAHGAAAPAQRRARSGGGEDMAVNQSLFITNTTGNPPTQGRTESCRGILLDRRLSCPPGGL